jgi:hypothetical protein
MGSYYAPNQFRLSSSAFQWGDITFTDYKTGCLRKILLQSLDIHATVESKYGALGSVNEDRHEQQLIASNEKYLREFEVLSTVASVPEISSSGHIDFLITDGTNPTRVDELKSVQSTNTRRNVIRNGEYVTENLAQLVAYMGEARVGKGRLIYSFYDKGKVTEERIFNVSIDDFGKIWVDSRPTNFAFNDVVAHRVAAAKVIRDKTVASRPYRWELQFVSPCTWCVFKAACDAHDSSVSGGTDSFVEKAKQCLEVPSERDAQV